jgi:hypothetical protein
MINTTQLLQFASRSAPRATIAFMRLAIAIVLVAVGITFTANVLGSLTGRYSGDRALPGQMPTWINVLLAGAVATAAFVGAYFLFTR